MGQKVLELRGPKQKPAAVFETVRNAREKHDFLPDAQHAFDQTLERHGYERLAVLENGYEYPSVDEWIEMKIAQGEGWVRSYAAFVRNKQTNEILFCKSKIKRTTKAGVDSFAKEAAALRDMKGLPAPGFREYIPKDPGSTDLETLLTERIDFSEGSVLLPEEWTPAAGGNVARVVRALEMVPLESVPKELQEQRDTIDTLVERNTYIFKPHFEELIRDISKQYAPHKRTVFIHGDMWPKNIIVGTDTEDPKITLVDWELAGLGYAGQDIARVWWGISANDQERSRASRALVKTYLEGSTREERDAQLVKLRFGLVYEALDRFDQDTISVLRDEKQLDEATAEKARKSADVVYERFATLLSILEEIVSEM